VLGVGCLAAAARQARAQGDPTLAEAGEPVPFHRYRSPQHFAFELRFGPYKPNVDSEFSARHPYQDFFGSGQHLLSQIEFDYEFFHKMGTAAIGVGAGYYSVTGTAPLDTGVPSGDQSTLKVAPVAVSLIYRFDYFQETRDIPLVPYGKLGLDWAYWQITDGNGEIAHADGGTGRGGTLGWHAAIGLALVLDMFDPAAARDFDADLGVNHTSLVFEYRHADISGFGRDSLHVGDTTWSAGLLLQF
jgi:hypothetical protein